MEVNLLNKLIAFTNSFMGIFLMDRSKFFLHMIQLEGYKNDEYRKWLSKVVKLMMTN